MLTVLCAALSSSFSCAQSIITKIAAKKIRENGSFCFNALKAVSAFILFLLLSRGRIIFHGGTLLSASIYSAALSMSTLFGYFALMLGSMTLTSLIVSYSVVLPCIYGIAFLNEKLTAAQILGLLLLAVSLFLILKMKENDSKRINLKWLLCVGITFFCNGICAIIQKAHQSAYPGSYCNEFMLFSLFFLSLVFVAATFIKKEKVRISQGKYAGPSGALMGLGNYITLLLSSKVRATLLFPMTTVFLVVLNTIASKLIFKDKLTVAHAAGIIIGVISVIIIK